MTELNNDGGPSGVKYGLLGLMSNVSFVQFGLAASEEPVSKLTPGVPAGGVKRTKNGNATEALCRTYTDT